MKIVDAATKRILSMVNIQEPDNLSSGLVQGAVIPDEEAAIIGSWSCTSGYVSEVGEEVLGEYFPMASPGRLVLYVDQLGSFFWHLALDIQNKGFYMEIRDFEMMAHLAVTKTYVHEQFHHCCDVTRQLFGGRFDRNVEEALAVAWSHRKVQELRQTWSSREARLSSPCYYELMRGLYHYSALGYRDWGYYVTDSDFALGLTRYLSPACGNFLEHSGINMAQVLTAIFAEVSDKAVVEEIV